MGVGGHTCRRCVTLHGRACGAVRAEWRLNVVRLCADMHGPLVSNRHFPCFRRRGARNEGLSDDFELSRIGGDANDVPG